jgi:hypothetical protein
MHNVVCQFLVVCTCVYHLSHDREPRLKMKRILKTADIFQAARYDVTRLKECLNEGKGNDINQIDCDGDTPLIHAAMMGNLPCLQFLLAHGADPNIQNRVRILL